MTYVYLSKRDLEAKYRQALTKLENARDEITYLDQGGFGDLWNVLDNIKRAINALRDERDLAAEKYGFTPIGGIGPQDWKGKNNDNNG